MPLLKNIMRRRVFKPTFLASSTFPVKMNPRYPEQEVLRKLPRPAYVRSSFWTFLNAGFCRILLRGGDGPAVHIRGDDLARKMADGLFLGLFPQLLPSGCRKALEVAKAEIAPQKAGRAEIGRASCRERV